MNQYIQTCRHTYYMIFVWLLTLCSQRNNKNLRRLNLTHIFAFKHVCVCVALWLCVWWCECVVKVIKPQQGRFESECCNTVSAKLCWQLRNVSKYKFSDANTKNKSIGYANYIRKLCIYVYADTITRESTNQRVFVSLSHSLCTYLFTIPIALI